MSNKTRERLNHGEQTSANIMERAKAECVFTDRLYEILLAYQRGEKTLGRKPDGIPAGNVGEFNSEMTRLYNLIWAATLELNDKAKPKKDKEQMDANHA